jgi:serine O-acetyltransferase
VSRDLNKTFWNEVERTKPALLFIDLVEEIFGLVSGHDEKYIVTNSDYLTTVKVPLLGQELHSINIESDRFKELWIQACQDFSRISTSFETKTVLIKLHVPERFVSKGAICSYDDTLLNKIKNLNLHLDWCYSVFLQNVDCHEITIPLDSQISELSEGKKIGIDDYSKELSGFVAAKVAHACNLEPYLVSPATNEVKRISSAEKVDLYLSAAARFLDAGDIPGIYELYMRGKSLKLSGDEKGARRCQQLITLVRNSNVPLSADLGKVSFGYGGIGIIIHANAKIGDYVTIGSNVTVGGRVGSSRRGRAVPVIGNRVYIATGAKILGGVEIGNHCIIGANAVVTKDIPDFSVVAGVPGKVIAKITPENLHKYSDYLYKGIPLPDVRKMMFNC